MKIPDGHNGQIGKHVDHPGGVDGPAFFVHIVEDAAAHCQADQGQKQQGQGEGDADHGHVVEGEGDRTEGICQPSGRISGQQEEGDGAEQKLLQKRVAQGNIEGDPPKAAAGHPLVGREGGHQGPVVKDAPGQSVPAQNDPVDESTEGQELCDVPSLQMQSAAKETQAGRLCGGQGEQEKDDDLDP